MAIIREITFGDGTVVRITDWGKLISWVVAPLHGNVQCKNRVNSGKPPEEAIPSEAMRRAA